MKVKVLRAFLIKGEAQKVGDEIDVSDALAAEMLQVGKIERVAPKPPVKGPMKSVGSALVAGSQKKELES